jgi:hypothetical protein
MISKVTLQKLPTLKEAVASLLQNFMDNEGYAELFDLKEVLFASKPEELGKELICQVEEMNEENMIRENLCPDCGHELRTRYIPATRLDPAEEITECPQCQGTYEWRAS